MQTSSPAASGPSTLEATSPPPGQSSHAVTQEADPVSSPGHGGSCPSAVPPASLQRRSGGPFNTAPLLTFRRLSCAPSCCPYASCLRNNTPLHAGSKTLRTHGSSFSSSPHLHAHALPPQGPRLPAAEGGCTFYLLRTGAFGLHQVHGLCNPAAKCPPSSRCGGGGR